MTPLMAVGRSLLLAIATLVGFGAVSESYPFELARNQPQAVGFAVDVPGAIVAQVTWRGGPLTVTLIGPDGAVARQTGTGNLRLQYTAAPAQLKPGSAWRVALRSAEPSGNPHDIVANGTLSIEHPSGNIDKLKAQAAVRLNQEKTALRSWSVQAGQRVAAGEQDQLLRYRQMQQQAEQRRQAALLTHVVALRSRVAPASPQLARAGTVNLHALQASSTPTPGPAPVLTSLSSAEAQPGDPILISGSGFGQSPAGTTVHAIIAPGRDVVLSPPDYQSDTQIQTSLPRNISGVTDNPHATIYVQTANGKSQLLLFHFIPATSITSLGVNQQAVVIDNSFVDSVDGWDDYALDATYNLLLHKGGAGWGGTGDDSWFRGVQLKNGWTVVALDLHAQINPDADAFVSLSHVGTADVSFTVHWWTSGGSYCCKAGWVAYRPTITIQGPAGIPFI